jgi:hypothetical protein
VRTASPLDAVLIDPRQARSDPRHRPQEPFAAVAGRLKDRIQSESARRDALIKAKGITLQSRLT